MGYVYAAMWIVIGLVLIFSVSREHKVFYLAGGFFIVLGLWWLANALFPEKELFSGVWGTVLRIVTLAALVVLSIFFVRERSRNIKKGAGENSPGTKPDSDETGLF